MFHYNNVIVVNRNIFDRLIKKSDTTFFVKITQLPLSLGKLLSDNTF